MTATPAAEEEQLRSQLSRLNALLLLSMLMSEVTDEQDVITLGAGAAPSLARCSLVGVSINGEAASRWWQPDPEPLHQPLELAGLPADGGPIDVAGWDWAWAYSMRAVGTSIGHLVIAADHQLPSDENFLLRVLAQQLAAAIRNARAFAFERTAAAELASVNARLEATVEALQQRMDIHDRLTRAAVSENVMEGIASALHEVTGRTAVIEDRYGNLRTWAGTAEQPSSLKGDAAHRERLLRQLLSTPTPQWLSGRLMQVVSPRPDTFAVLALVDPDGSAGPAEFAALEYGATILAAELARQRSLADTDIRLRRDLVEDLLAGTNLDSVVERGEKFEIDVTRPHAVAIFEGRLCRNDPDRFFSAVQRVARGHRLGSLLVARGGAVVLVTPQEPDWDALQREVLEDLGSGSCRIGIGAPTGNVTGYARSYREAQLSLSLLKDHSSTRDVAVFSRLGVYRLLSSSDDPQGVERFAREWIGRLLDYDEKRQADLVLTLSTYLDCGGRYDETAAALSVHRSTLKYRLQRIRQISELSLGEPDVNFNLQLACRAWRTLQAMRQAQPGGS